MFEQRDYSGAIIFAVLYLGALAFAAFCLDLAFG